MSEENVVSLIVKCDCLSSLKLWTLREQACKHTSHSVSKTSCKVVEYHLWDVTGVPAMTLQHNAEVPCQTVHYAPPAPRQVKLGTIYTEVGL